MAVKFSNNAVTTLSAGISAGATSFTVASASTFPTLGASDWTYVSLTSEVVKVTAISGTTFTCDATSTAHVSGESVELRMTAEILNDVALGDDESLDAISNASAITGNAVDVFIYDTSNDSDGGAWRKRTQATSWYNETLNTSTRGSRKEFPSVAVIVAESNKVTIYDGDTPDLDMWMVFTVGGSDHDTSQMLGDTGNIRAITMLNGTLPVASGSWFRYVSFVADESRRLSTSTDRIFKGNISARNSQLGTTTGGLGQSIINQVGNDVAMTVLPNAPIDSTTGLPIPTIAVGTNGGVSVIKDDGSVVDITGAWSRNFNVKFTDDNKLLYQVGNAAGQGQYRLAEIPTSDYSSGSGSISTNVVLGGTQTYGPSVVPYITDYSGGDYLIQATDSYDLSLSGGRRVIKYARQDATENSMVNYLTSTYNSGYMTGDIKGAWLSDTDTTNVVGTELVTNGTFDTDTTGWTAETGGSSIAWNASGYIDVTRLNSPTAGVFTVQQAITGLVVGRVYYITGTIITASVQASILVGDDNTGTPIYTDSHILYSNNAETNGFGTFPAEAKLVFRATATTMYIGLGARSDATGTATFDNISVRIADADRSVNNNGLQVNGTITKTAVATGADLVAYSGFSASNYLEQPYNSDLDFGTGDFSVMGWTTLSVLGGTKAIIGVGDLSGSNGGWLLGYQATGIFRVWEAATTSHSINLISSTSIAPLNVWTHVCFSRTNGVMKISVNGVSESVVSDARTMTHTNAVLNIGISDNGAYPNDVGSLALWRISATAPTAAQILEIYNAERPMFTENANVTLHGTSDAVTALSFDDSNEELVVATSGGLSVFKGLIRVDEEDGNFTEVSQQGGMRIVEKA